MSGNLLLVESLVGQEFDVLQEDVDAFFISDDAARREAARLLRTCWNPFCKRVPTSSVGICASGLNWWPSSRMKMASRSRSRAGKRKNTHGSHSVSGGCRWQPQRGTPATECQAAWKEPVVGHQYDFRG